MKQIFYTLTTLIILSSCGSSKNFLNKKDEEKALQNAIKALDKKRSSAEAEAAIPVLYSNIQQKHLASINAYANSNDLDRFDWIAGSYNRLQRAYEAIMQSSYAASLINPVDYSSHIQLLNQQAAEAYYNKGEEYLSLTGRDNAREAYRLYSKSNQWVYNYRDVKNKMNEAYANAVVNVVINPVTTSGYFFNTGWNYNFNNYSGQNFQQCLIRDLGGSYSSRYPARFYTDWEARNTNETMDWAVDLTLRDVEMPRPIETSRSRGVSREIEIGRDTANRPIYRTVTATITTVRSSFTARARMDVNIYSLESRRNIGNNSFYEDYIWQSETSTISGNQDALSDADWRDLHSNYRHQPTRNEIMNELYSKLYPRVKNEIACRVDW